MKILVADDDAQTVDYLRRGLSQAGHVVSVAVDGTEALFRATEDRYDAIVLDRMLPRLDGLSVLRMLRAGGIQTPVLLLTAMSGIADRVEGLESGADDYLVKPFAFAELQARLNVLARRPSAAATTTEIETCLRVQDIEFDLAKRIVRRDGKRVDLQPRELLMLEVLMRNPHRVMTRTMLLERVWDFDFDPQTNIVETHISRLRAKLNVGFSYDAIVTVRGSGYMIRSE